MRRGTLFAIPILATGALCAQVKPARGEGFQRGRAWTHLQAIVELGPRQTESTGAQAARAYVQHTLQAAGATVQTQPFTAQTPVGPKRMVNIWGERRGTTDGIIIVSAHLDTKDMPATPSFVGANDSASGVAVVLALAESLQEAAPPSTIWFVCYDGEEAFGPWSDTNGLYGSRAFVNQLREEGTLSRIAAVINIDMVGDEHLRLVRDQHSTPWLQDRLWKIATETGHGSHFTERTMSVTDDHIPFLREEIPAVDLIDFSYGPLSRDNRWWHTLSDTVAHCRSDSVDAVGAVVFTFLTAHDALPSAPAPR